MKNDREAEFLRCYDDQADALFRHVYLRVRDRESAKDIVQEAFCRVWEYMSGGNEISNLRAFLYKTALNLIIDRSRKHTTDSLDALAEGGTDFRDTSRDSNTDAHAIEEECLHSLRMLNEPYRSTLLLRFVDDLTPKEIAEIQNETENVISVRINRGLAKIRTLLGVELKEK